jgi:beta-phosphoglucomutase
MPNVSTDQLQYSTLDSTSWSILETEFNPTRQHAQETVFTLGNGYLGTRGTFEEGYPNESTAVLIHGIFDDAPIVTTELVNCPNWLPLTIKIDGDRFSLDSGEILNYSRRLNLRLGLLTRNVQWRSPAGHILEFRFERFCSFADRHVQAIRCHITSVNFEGRIEVESTFDKDPETLGAKHWTTLTEGSRNHLFWLSSETLHSKMKVAIAAKLVVSSEDGILPLNGNPETCALGTATHIRPQQTITVEKIVAIYTSREAEVPLANAMQRLDTLPRYNTLFSAHLANWAIAWQNSDIVIEGDPKAQVSVRYNLFQMMIAASPDDDRVSIPAKTLSGYAYRGHVFWDTEIFIVPFFTLTQPAIARNLLTYRYHTLEGARKKAQEAGFEGAMYPWESAGTGEEVTPRWVTGPNGETVRIWCGDIELHISTDVAYAAWHYWQNTGDDTWMRDYGAEMILDTAVFWGSRAEWNAEQQRYEIRDVIGPDEYHEHVDNNIFTNTMVQWHLRSALSLWDWLAHSYPETAAALEGSLNLSSERRQQWAKVAELIVIHHDRETGLMEQCDGFFNLIDVDLNDYEPRTKSMQALLGIEPTNERQILKQPDVLMMLYLLRHQYDQQTLRTNWDYYSPRTDHVYGSSLGPAVHAILACDLDQANEGYEHFMRAALVDVEDVRSNAGEGIHAASCGGVWQAVVFGFGGIRFTEFGPIACPNLPTGWTRLKFRLNWRNQWYDFDLSTGDAPAQKAVIFDLDGVITDSSELHYLAWKQLADEEGISFDRESNETMRGLSRRESLLQLLGDRTVTEAEIQDMMDRKNRYYVDMMQNITPADLLPGVFELLCDLQASGVKIALGSSSKNARRVLEQLGIIDMFNAIADGNSVDRHKPAPDVFLFAADQLGLTPEQCVVVEDASAGIEAARAGGMQAVGLGPKERVGAAHVVLPDLDGVSWQDLQAQLSQHLEGVTA